MIEIRTLHVHYQTDEGAVHAVRGVDITVEEGEFYTLLGPSGCGKTTTLRCIAGLETQSEGEITIDGATVYSASRGISVPTYRRDIGMVFQSYAIWPHMNVFQNTAFPLQEMRPRIDRATIRDRVRKALALVQLDGLEDRPAPFLSGGQQQRLALARALVKEPKVLLLDEPLSNLDAKLREETRVELRELVKRLGITTVYVTHDQIEALTMSDVVAVMDNGEIMQESTPFDIYETPANRFVASFIGQTNFLDGTVSLASPGNGAVETPCGSIRCMLSDGMQEGDSVTVVIRPEDVHLAADRTNGAGGDAAGGLDGGRDNMFEGEVRELQFLGEAIDAQVAVGDLTLRL
ncbi:MAG: ABC transporter ATP-binding protein, partial [Qipengyuania citrea]